MDYKRIIRSQQLRFKLLRLLQWLPDSIMLCLQYRIKMGFWPNFRHPKRFTEKLQLYKMNYRNPVMHQCIDKYEVRKYVESKGLDYILNKLYGVYVSPDDIDFEKLPEKFVIKTTTGSGGQNVVIVKDKAIVNWNEIKRELLLWNSDNTLGALAGREWAYTRCKPRIIVEQLLIDPTETDSSLIDYKFFCFDGKPKCIQVDTGRFDGHHQNYYDMQWQSMNVHCTYPAGDVLPMPKNFETMKQIASLLSKDFPFVRVDLYNINGKIYFGELTFYPSSGYGKFHPDDFDFQLGSYFTEYK